MRSKDTGKKWVWPSRILEQEVVMYTLSLEIALQGKSKEITAREKREVIVTFLYEYGEHASWEDWCEFLDNHQVKGFELTSSVN